jgi:hypothetical protein
LLNFLSHFACALQFYDYVNFTTTRQLLIKPTHSRSHFYSLCDTNSFQLTPLSIITLIYATRARADYAALKRKGARSFEPHALHHCPPVHLNNQMFSNVEA